MLTKLITFLVCLFWSGILLAAAPLSITISGINGDALSNAQKRANKLIEQHSATRQTRDIELLSQQISNEIKQSLKPYGYFNADVTDHLYKPNKSWRARYRVIPGPRVKLNRVSINITGAGRADPEYIKLLHNIALKRGQPLNTPLYTQTKDSLLDLAAERGYFDANMLTSEVKVNLQSLTADVTINFATGRRYRFGDVKFIQINDGAKSLSNHFLQRFVNFQSGDAFLQSELSKLQDQLQSSHYFSQVAITSQPHRARNGRVPIIIKLYATKTKRYEFGAGIGTDSGVRGLVGVKMRRLTSEGHYGEAKAKGSFKNNGINGTLNVSYNMPGHNPTRDLHKIAIETERTDEEDYGISNSIKLGYSYITEIYGWQQTAGIRYQVERSSPNNEKTFSSDLLIPSLSWLRVQSDDPVKPNNGYKLNFNIRGASKKLLSNTSFVQGWVSAKWLKTFRENTRLILRGDLGMVGIDDIEDLPLSLRFAAGGSQSIRGYGFKDIKDGRTMSIASVELQQRIYGDFYGAVFCDFGDIGPSFFDQSKRGVGVGVVWRSPIGAVELTIAKALDKPGQPSLVELSMGPEL